MSGVFGYFGAGAAAAGIARSMGARMRHSEHQVVEVAAAGTGGAMGRIASGLLNREPQPLRGAGGAVTLCLSGELYHQQKRLAQLAAQGVPRPADDAGLALEVYLRDGTEGLTQLEGAFAVSVWDQRSDELIVVNDRFGLYQHFFAHAGGALIFAPEIKGVLAAPGVPRKLDLTAVAQYTRFQQLLDERTWFDDVELLPPATLLRYRPCDDQLSLRRYWDWDRIVPLERISFNEAVEECIRLFQRAVDAMTAPPLRVGVYLSGGLDGRTILGFIDPATQVTTLTYGAGECRDVVYGAALARRAGRPNRWFAFADGRWVLEHGEQHLALTEGLHSWMHAHGISTLDRARELIDVNLSGWDGGTTLGGRLDEYATDASYRHAPDEAGFRRRLFEGFCRVFTWPGLTDGEAEALFRPPGNPELADLARDSFDEAVARTAHYAGPYRADYFYLLQHVRRSTNSMIVFQRSAIEVRCPFFDYDLLEFLYALPEQIRATPALHEAVITRRMPGLALVPNEKTGQLPHSSPLVRGGYQALGRAQRVLNRVVGPVFPQRQRLYADYEHYLRTDLRAWAESILFDSRTAERGLFNPAEVRRLWQRHVAGDELWTIGKVAPLITLELVIRSLSDEHTSLAAMDLRCAY